VNTASLSRAIGKLLEKKHLTVSVCESCTGGMLGSIITQIPGSSRYFVGGVIAYADRVGRSKIRPLRDTLGFIQLIVRTGMYFAPLRVLMPLVAARSIAFVVSLGYDVLVLANLTDKTIILLLFAMNTALFGLLADMIDKRS